MGALRVVVVGQMGQAGTMSEAWRSALGSGPQVLCWYAPVMAVDFCMVSLICNTSAHRSFKSPVSDLISLILDSRSGDQRCARKRALILDKFFVSGQ